MSTRQLQTKTTGTLALLSVLALIAVGVTWRPAGGDADAAALAAGQQARLADMDRQLEQLVSAEDFGAVTAARSSLSRSVLAFDRTLEALVHGGTLAGDDGRPVKVKAVRGDAARQALSGASAIWLQVGLPLADLAAGDYSVFSAAGQQAVRGLRENSGELSTHLAAVTAACDGTTGTTGPGALIARLAAGLCLLALAVTMVLRRRALRPAAPDQRSSGGGLAPAGAVSRWSAAPEAPAPRPAAPVLPYKSPIDFEDVSAAVDQMTVDMSTIAASTEKMRTAIDSVGVALQGMIYRLNDLGDDTAEGYRLVRGANNAAGYTSQVAAELAENVREMGAVVSRVTNLAQKCRQTAAAIDQEAAQTGRTGAGFNGAVAGQVKALAAQTSNATAEVEQTVSEMLARTREYEESVAQILKHVSAIHRVSQNLGQVVLDPPASAVVGAPRLRAQVAEPVAAAAAAAPAAAPRPVVAAAAPEPEPDEAPEPTTAELAARTAAAIEDEAEPAEPAFDADPDEMQADEKPKATFSLDTHEADAPPPPPPTRPSVFMLNRPRVPEADVATPAPEPAAPAMPAAPAAPSAPAATSFESSVESAVEPYPGEEAVAAAVEADEAPTEPPAADDTGSEPAVSNGPRPNIFMLNDPKPTPKPHSKV